VRSVTDHYVVTLNRRGPNWVADMYDQGVLSIRLICAPWCDASDGGKLVLQAICALHQHTENQALGEP